MKIPADGGKKIYSCNEGNSLQWDAPILKYVEQCKDSGYAARYVGSMLADVHRTLLYGGIFLYPADKSYPSTSMTGAPSSWAVQGTYMQC